MEKIKAAYPECVQCLVVKHVHFRTAIATHNRPMLHYDELVAYAVQIVETVLRHHDGISPLLQLVNRTAEKCDRRIVQICRRLVQQQNLALQHQCRGNRNLLLLPARQLRELPSKKTLKRKCLHDRAQPPLNLITRHTEVFTAEHEVGQHIERKELIVGILEHRRRNPRNIPNAEILHILSGEENLPLRRAPVEAGTETIDAAQER